MPYQTLIAPAEVAPQLEAQDWVIVDCRFSLGDAERGRADYERAHIPGAVYAHLNADLSSPIIPGVTGRHPLPNVEQFAATLSRWGIGPGVQVVTYDDDNGSMAARLWWMLRWLGHDTVAVLDGGWARWQREGYPSRGGEEHRPAAQFVPAPRPELVASVDEVLQLLHNPDYQLVDARGAARYRGDEEPVDPAAGHIPGAISHPFTDNLDAEGKFLSPAALRERFTAQLGAHTPEQAVMYCGSGVSAAHNVLALVHAGLGDTRLYPGSWSEWIADPTRPIAKGEEPG